MTKRRSSKRLFASFHIHTVIIIIAIAFLSYAAFTSLDKRLSETAIEISHFESKLAANKIINKAVIYTLDNLQLSSSESFLSRQEAPEAVSANTILINQFCALMSESITDNLIELSNHAVPVPLGQLMGIDILAASGPNIFFTLRPMGAVNVDYDTAFESVGINQTNFKIWINIDMDMKVVYPMRQEIVSLSRKMMLVDTVINGTVPEQYLNFGK